MPERTERVWFVEANGQRWGPYTSTELWQWLTEGRLTSETPCWRQGQNAPIPLSRVIAQEGQASALPGAGSFPTSPSPGLAQADMAQVFGAASPDESYWQEPLPPEGASLGKKIQNIALIVVALCVLSGTAYFGYKSLAPAPKVLAPALVPQTAPPIPVAAPQQPDPYQQKINERVAISGLLDDGRKALANGSLAEARRAYESVQKQCAGKQEYLQQAEEAAHALDWIQLSQHPEKRFVVYGATIGANTVVKIYDTRDGQEFKMHLGESFGEFRLDAYDADKNTAQIFGNGRAYTIAHP